MQPIRLTLTKWRKLVVVLSLALVVLLVGVSRVAAQGSGYDLSWHSFAPGGTITAGGYTLQSAIGEPFGAPVSAGGYTLSGSYILGPATPAGDMQIYIPVLKAK